MKLTFTTVGLLSKNRIKDYEYEEYILPKSYIAIFVQGLHKITKNMLQHAVQLVQANHTLKIKLRFRMTHHERAGARV